jgi:hypothetical protein
VTDDDDRATKARKENLQLELVHLLIQRLGREKMGKLFDIAELNKLLPWLCNWKVCIFMY